MWYLQKNRLCHPEVGNKGIHKAHVNCPPLHSPKSVNAPAGLPLGFLVLRSFERVGHYYMNNKK